jgi:uncharacterized repeat protein (TIGR01451 family)
MLKGFGVGLVMFAILPVQFAWADMIAEQNFDGLDDSATETLDSLTDGSQLTNSSSINSDASMGMTFETFWVDSRAQGTGPVIGGDVSDFIGVSSDDGVGAPDVSPDGTAVATGTEQNFRFNDGDGRLELIFDSVDLSYFENRTFSLNYWINDDDYETDDFFVITISDGTNTHTAINFSEADLEANESLDDGSMNWKSLSVDMENLIATQGFTESNIILTITADTGAAVESIFIDKVQFVGDAVALFDYSDAPSQYPMARHSFGAGLAIGGSVSQETTDQTSSDANGDGGDDGVNMPNFLIVNSYPEIQVTVTNPTASEAFVTGWIDYNGDGLWDETEQSINSVTTSGLAGQAVTTVSVAAGATATVTLQFPQIPEDAISLTGGTTFARFRVSTSAASISTPNGLAPDGEVEDYFIVLTTPATAIFLPAQMNVIMQYQVVVADPRVRYIITLRNLTSQNQANNAGAEFTDPLPIGVAFVANSLSASSGTASYNAGTNTIRWDGSIPSGGEVLIRFTVDVLDASKVVQAQDSSLATTEGALDSLPWASFLLLGSILGSSAFLAKRRQTLWAPLLILIVVGMVGCTGNILPGPTITTEICNQATFNFDSDGNGTNETIVLSEDPLSAARPDPTCFTAVP